MACRLVGTKPLSEPMLEWTLRNKLQWNCNQNTKLFIHEDAGFEISLVWSSKMSKNDNRTSGIPARLVQRMTAYISDFHISCIGFVYFRQVNGTFGQVNITIHLPDGQVHSIGNFEARDTSENIVCEMAAILSWFRWVKSIVMKFLQCWYWEGQAHQVLVSIQTCQSKLRPLHLRALWQPQKTIG